MPIGLAIAAGIGLAKLGVGIAQQRKGKKLEEATDRPDYEIPEEVFQNLNQAQQMALQGLPAEQKKQYIQNLQQSGQFALSQSGSRKAGLTGIAQLNQQQNFGMQNMLAMDAQARQQNQMQVMQQRQNVAGFRDQAFELNQLNPYYEDISQARGLQSSGLQNIFSGGESFAYNVGEIQKSNQAAAAQLAGGLGGGAGGIAGAVGGAMGAASRSTAPAGGIGGAAANQGIYTPPGINDPQLRGVQQQQQPYSLTF